MSNERLFHLGDIVKVNISFLGEPVGVRAYVYEEYQLSPEEEGISIITENGCNIGGFNPIEQSRYLEFVGKTGFQYNFRNVMQLDKDFENVIKPYFSRALKTSNEKK